MSTVWFHDKNRDRQITSQGSAVLPTLAFNGKAVHYLLKSGLSSRGYVNGELWRTDLTSGRAEPVLPGVGMTYYSFSHDGRKLLYASDSSAPPGLWITDLDRGTLLGKLMRVNEDGSERHEISPDPILYLHDVSPDGQWAVVNAPGAGAVGAVSNVRAYSLRDGKPSTICDVCGGGFGPRQVGKPFITWAPDGRFLYLSLHWVSLGGADKTAVIPLRGAPFNLTPHGSISEADLRKTFGARIVNERDVYPGPDPDTYVFTRYTTLTNIYRIIVP